MGFVLVGSEQVLKGLRYIPMERKIACRQNPANGDGHHGPWTPFGARPFIQDGQNNAAVPTESNHQFLRLHRP